MAHVLRIAKRMQFLDAIVPLRWRVPFRYAMQRLVGGLEPEMTLLEQLVPRGKTAVDIGGNRGTYTYALSKLAEKVITFEPIPACVRILEAWAQHVHNVEIHQCGLGDKEGILTLHIPRLGGSLFTTRASFLRTSGEGIEFSVPVHTLDKFGLQDVGFIKIDVEGFEYWTLQGARETLERCRPAILIEIDSMMQNADEFERTFAWLQGLGYRSHYLHGGELRPCDSEIRAKDPPLTNYIFLPNNPR